MGISSGCQFPSWCLWLCVSGRSLRGQDSDLLGALLLASGLMFMSGGLSLVLLLGPFCCVGKSGSHLLPYVLPSVTTTVMSFLVLFASLLTLVSSSLRHVALLVCVCVCVWTALLICRALLFLHFLSQLPPPPIRLVG